MSGQSEIIVRCEVDDLLPIECADGRLLVIEHAKLEMRALGLEFIELAGEVGERVGAGCDRHGCLEDFLGADLRKIRDCHSERSEESKHSSGTRGQRSFAQKNVLRMTTSLDS